MAQAPKQRPCSDLIGLRSLEITHELVGQRIARIRPAQSIGIDRLIIVGGAALGCWLVDWLAIVSAWRLASALAVLKIREGQLERYTVLEGLADLHHAIADGFELVPLPEVGQEQLLAMPITGTGRDGKPGPPPEIRHRPAAAAAPLAKGPQDPATEQNIPFLDRWHGRPLAWVEVCEKVLLTPWHDRAESGGVCQAESQSQQWFSTKRSSP